MHVALEVGHAPLQLRALTPNALQLVALGADARVGALRGQGGGHQEREAEQQRAHAYTVRRCLPTDTALPTRPIIAPNSSPSAASRWSKNTVSMM